MFVNFKVLLVASPPGELCLSYSAPLVMVSALCDGCAGAVSVLFVIYYSIAYYYYYYYYSQ